MHLASLTLRGFKSFHSSTTLRFEPGITCVVGPNGSGKSNVVDAIAWVLGEQGAKSLRGGKMEDVIFAGTAGRPPLGRAEVVLTIDNSDGALPIDYAEVTVGRLMYRSGESEYAINGRSCRLLDVQELLSDSGIGRELHVVVGQGQLDAVLSARPEDRRAFIEEAAGVLKHRRRKEKALRKLEAMAANLTRLCDLTVELRRQLRPLGQQAEVARRAATVQAELRDARLRLLADDLCRLREDLAGEERAEAAASARRAELEAALADAQSREVDLDHGLRAGSERLAVAADTYYQLSALVERFRATAELAAERQRHLDVEQQALLPAGEPNQLDAEAADARRREADLTALLAGQRTELAAAVGRRTEVERRLAAAEGTAAASEQALSHRRESRARLAAEIAAVHSRVVSTEAELDRLSAASAVAAADGEAAEADLARLETEVADRQRAEADLDARHEEAGSTLAETEEQLTRYDEEERTLDRERSALVARREALGVALDRRDGAATIAAAEPRPPGVLGPLLSLLEVRRGAEAAVAAALGATADAVAVRSLTDAVAVLELLKRTDGGRVGLLVGDGSAPGDAAPPRDGSAPASTLADGSPRGEGWPVAGGSALTRGWPVLPDGLRYAVELVDAPETLRPAVRHALERIAVVPSLPAAIRLVESAPELRAVTADGDLLGAGWVSGGSGTPSRLELRAAVDEADRALAAVVDRIERLTAAKATGAERRAAAARRVERALEGLHESDARLAALGEQLGHLGERARAVAAESDRLARASAEAIEARDRDLAALAALEQGQEGLDQATSPEPEPAAREREETARECEAARVAEVELRLAVRTTEERTAALRARAEGAERRAAAARSAAARAAADRDRRTRVIAVAKAVEFAARVGLAQTQAAQGVAASERSAAESDRAERERRREVVRAEVARVTAELSAVAGTAHRDEIARTEQRLRIVALEDRAAGEYGVPPAELVAEYGPDVPVPAAAPVGGPGPDVRVPSADAADGRTTAYDRDEQERRARAAERALAALGRVNPLALEEYAALEERHGFLARQLEDLQATRRDLLTVVREVDERVEQVFAAAYADVAREFEIVFAALFPGGHGRLLLTDPEDLLTSGVEIEARPPGKKLQRLSLLSGGERSLTAVALLVAIFRARPSPFYVLDEVEAALDDRNLSRLLSLLVELRETSQLIVVTHQKRTMEIADTLYGVSMRSDGITAVISQRLRAEPELASA